VKNIIIILLASLSYTSFGQGQDEKVIGIYTGFSTTGFAYRLASNITVNDSANTDFYGGSNLPVFGAMFDYGISSNFSIGAMFGIQHFNADINSRSVNIGDTLLTTRNVDINLNRLYLGITPKYHYNMANEQLELYSGVRAGFIFWQGNFDVEDSNIDVLSNLGAGRPAISLIPIGGRYYMTDELALNFELATGAPAIITLGLNFRL